MFKRKLSRTENFQDKIARLYGGHEIKETMSNDETNEIRSLTRTCTLQVTDACNLCCTYCVTGDTMILMADSTKKQIKDIKIGDIVMGFEENPEQNALIKVFPTTVEQTFKHETDRVRKIKLDNGLEITLTPNHKILVFHNNLVCFVESADICIGDKVFYLSDGTTELRTSDVISIVQVDVPTSVYNIGTSTHTYIANDFAVHNCYQINKKHHSMSYDIAKKYIDMILANDVDNDYINCEISEGLIIEFIGGEPLMEIDLITKITDYLIDEMIRLDHPWLNKFMLSICSNGVLYSDPRVQKYIEQHKHYLSFSISIDGNKELHDACRVFPDGTGSYDIAIEGVKHFREHHHGHMGSKMTLAPGNIDKTFVAVTNLIDLGYEEIFLNCVYEEGWNAEYAAILYDQLKRLADYIIDNNLFDKIYLSIFDDAFFSPMAETENQNWCGGTGSMLSCDWKGDMYPCIRYMESSLGDSVPPLKIGNVDTGLLATQEEKDTVKCLRCITRRSQSTDECFNCPIANGCSWCSAYNYQTFGTADKRATFICIMHKARALANAYLWNKGARKFAPFLRFKMYVPDEWALEIISQDELNMLKQLESFTEADIADVLAFEVEPGDTEYAAHREYCLIHGQPIYTNPVTGNTEAPSELLTINGSVEQCGY